MMNNKQIKRSSGQILVLIVLMLVGLLAMLALVLDGGNLYSQRRQAQLAADAGALAGARAHCDPDVTASPESEANTYVTNNDATMKSFSLNEDIHEVTVVTEITFDTFFLHILGRPQLTAEALAAARCELGSSASVLPVAWSCKPPGFPVEGEPPGETCNLEMNTDNDDCVYPIDENPEELWDTFYIVMDSDDLDESIYCAEEYYKISCPDAHCDTPTDPDWDEEFCTSIYPRCDLDCDGDLDYRILSEGSFGWMDLDGGGSDANELSQWILHPEDTDVKIHHWYAAKAGVAVSVFDTVGDELEDGNLDNVIVPVFDAFCHGLPDPLNYDCLWHLRDPGGDREDIVVESGGTFDDYFHIIGFANYKVMCVDAGSHKNCILHDDILGLPPNIKTIEGCFVAGVSSDIRDVGGGADFDAYTLVLSR
jgi:hypothetical protein